MHICLLSIEILVDIFAATYDTRWGQGSLGTLAALARTCKEFKEPALNILWKDIHGFGPLVLCLPEGVRGITEQGQLTLTRPLFSGEWKIFNSYACRIRSLFIYSKLLDEIDGQVMKVLVSAPSPTLLPNLHSLEWWDGRDFFLPLLHALLAPTIKSMKLYSHPEEPWEPSFAKSTLLISLGARCPHIQEFVCPYSCDSDEHSDAMNDTVCCWSKLIHLETGVLNTQALAHLTSSPSLKFLDFMSCGSVNDTKPDSIPIFTSKLDKVSIAAPSFPILIQCLRSVHFITCRSVVLSVYDHDSLLSRPLDIPDLFVSFAECFSSTLEQFAVHFPGLGHISTEKLVGPPFMLAFSAVAPLLSFSCLKRVSLSKFCASAIDDAMIKTMAQSWPQLEEFSLGCGACWQIPPSLTFTGLVHLIRHCQDLREIAIRFRASVIIRDSEPFSKTIPNAKITDIYVGNSPIDAGIAAAVACQLHTLLPNLTIVDRFPWVVLRGELPPDFEDFEVEWGRVEEFLEVLVEGAKMRETQGQVLQECSLPD